MNRKKVLVFIDHDLTIRHFVQSGVFNELETKHDVRYVFHEDSTSEKAGIFTDIGQLGIENYRLLSLPRRRMGSWFNLYAVTALRRQIGTKHFGPLRKIIGFTVGGGRRGQRRAWAYAALGTPGVYHLFRYIYLKRMGIYAPLLELIRNEKADILLHPSILAGYFINELGPIAQKLGVPFVAMMNSFDNPSQKSVCTVPPDKLVVWGPQTKDHAIRYMGLRPEAVEIFGAAQFQIYRKPVSESEAELRRMFQVPPDVPVILYAGASMGVNETRHLKLIDEVIASGSVRPCHVIYRPHPWRSRLNDGEEDFFGTRFSHVSMDPHMADRYRGIVSQPDRALYLADYDVTRKLMALVSGAVSTLSTLMLEVVLHHKPVLSFLPTEDDDKGYNQQYLYDLSLQLAHFDGFFDAPGVHRCSEISALANALSTLLVDAQDPSIADALRRHAAYYAVMDGPTYGERLRDLVDRLLTVPAVN